MSGGAGDAVVLSGLSVDYGDFRLGPLDLALAAGERVALVGPNGAGKSTTLRTLAGRLDGYQGSVLVSRQEVRDHRVETRGRVGVLPERLLGFGWMKVSEHLSILAGFYPTWDADYAAELCTALDVPLSKPLGKLSKGNKTKLSLVAAEAFRPPILVLDEPTSGVDPVMRRRLLEVVKRCLDADPSRTLIFSTHILEDVDALAHRVLLLRDGRLVGDHEISDLVHETPSTPLTEILSRRLAS